MRWITHNFGLKLFALALAVGMVWIKAQEKIQTRMVPNIPIVLQNRPVNIILADSWPAPMVRASVLGPKNIIDLIRPDQTTVRIDLSTLSLLPSEAPVNFLLNRDMFRTNLDTDSGKRISVDEDTIRPRQVSFHVQPWDLKDKKPVYNPAEKTDEQIHVPLYRVEKEVEVVLPTSGAAPDGVVFQGYSIDPKTIRLTGRMEALEQIQSVSTIALDLSGIKADTLPVYLPIQLPENRSEIWAIQPSVRDATVTIKVSKKKK